MGGGEGEDIGANCREEDLRLCFLKNSDFPYLSLFSFIFVLLVGLE